MLRAPLSLARNVTGHVTSAAGRLAGRRLAPSVLPQVAPGEPPRSDGPRWTRAGAARSLGLGSFMKASEEGTSRAGATSAIALRRVSPEAQPIAVIAHRGASALAPENTIPAYEAAIRIGARFMECDIHRTCDGHWVVIHDDTTLRTTGSPGNVHEMTLAEIKALDAGAWKGSEFAGTKIPTLEELLAVTRGEGRKLAVEIKPPPRETRDEAADARDIDEICDALARAGAGPEDLVIFAWAPDILRRMREKQPEMTTTLLMAAPPMQGALRQDLFRKAAAAGATILGVENKRLDKAFFEMAHKEGLKVWVWTVDDPRAMERLAGFGADGIISNDPGLAARILGAPAEHSDPTAPGSR